MLNKEMNEKKKIKFIVIIIKSFCGDFFIKIILLLLYLIM